MDVAVDQILGGKTLPYFFGTRIRKYLVVERGAISPEKVALPMVPPAWREAQVNLSQPRKSCASTGVNTHISRAKVVPAQAPQYRQCALISDFLDLAQLSKREEAPLATNWIKDRPEGLKQQNLTMATRTGRSTGSLRENPTADVPLGN